MVKDLECRYGLIIRVGFCGYRVIYGFLDEVWFSRFFVFVDIFSVIFLVFECIIGIDMISISSNFYRGFLFCVVSGNF